MTWRLTWRLTTRSGDLGLRAYAPKAPCWFGKLDYFVNTVHNLKARVPGPEYSPGREPYVDLNSFAELTGRLRASSGIECR